MHSPTPWENKLLYPLVLKDQRKESLMTARLSALVKRVEEFHLQWIQPLDLQEKLTFKCQWLADPSRYPAEGEILTSPFYHCTKNLVLIWLGLLSKVALPQEQLNGFMACLFDKGVPAARHDNWPLPFSHDNPPPSVRTLSLHDFYLHGN
jgi:hypothetical protein